MFFSKLDHKILIKTIVEIITGSVVQYNSERSLKNRLIHGLYVIVHFLETGERVQCNMQV